MRFAIFSSMGNTTWSDVVALWRHAEQTGWDAACVTDHFMPNTPERTGDMLESWTTLTALAIACCSTLCARQCAQVRLYTARHQGVCVWDCA